MALERYFQQLLRNFGLPHTKFDTIRFSTAKSEESRRSEKSIASNLENAQLFWFGRHLHSQVAYIEILFYFPARHWFLLCSRLPEPKKKILPEKYILNEKCEYSFFPGGEKKHAKGLCSTVFEISYSPGMFTFKLFRAIFTFFVRVSFICWVCAVSLEQVVLR